MPKSYRSRIAAALGRVGGRIGGKSRSKKKVDAVRKNVAKARAVAAQQRKGGSK